jgi:hypothetical protein
MKKNSNNALSFNKSTINELTDNTMLKINGGTLETSGYCCETTKQFEMINA